MSTITVNEISSVEVRIVFSLRQIRNLKPSANYPFLRVPSAVLHSLSYMKYQKFQLVDTIFFHNFP